MESYGEYDPHRCLHHIYEHTNSWALYWERVLQKILTRTSPSGFQTTKSASQPMAIDPLYWCNRASLAVFRLRSRVTSPRVSPLGEPYVQTRGSAIFQWYIHVNWYSKSDAAFELDTKLQRRNASPGFHEIASVDTFQILWRRWVIWYHQVDDTIQDSFPQFILIQFKHKC